MSSYRFTLDKKQIAVVRYYETLWMISDGSGERIYTGTDEKRARAILGLLNKGYKPERVWPLKARSVKETKKQRSREARKKRGKRK